MVKLEREVKTEENTKDINRWQSAWEITKAVGEIGGYFGLMGLGYYIGDKVDEGMLGAIIFGFLACYHQDRRNGAFDNSEGSMEA